MDYTLPKDCHDFILINGGTYLENKNTDLYFFKIEEMEDNNISFKLGLSSFFFVASNGGGAGLAYSKNDDKLYSLPFIASDKDAIFVADSFIEFLEKFHKNEIWIY